MKIENKAVRDRFRFAVVCEHCKTPSQTGRDPAHIFPRGLGDAKRIDAPWNLAALCRWCHSRSHAGGEPTKAQLLAIAALRERTTPGAIEELVYFLLRQSKGTVLAEVDVSELSDECVRLLRSVS